MSTCSPTDSSATLPRHFDDAGGVLWRALESPDVHGVDDAAVRQVRGPGGIDDPDVALPLLAGLTPRWSSEAPIRPFIERHPELTYEHLRRWVTAIPTSTCAGSCRRAPGPGCRGHRSCAGSSRTRPRTSSCSRPLVDDPSPYVRRSVANHLNDISKDHPDLAVDLAAPLAGPWDGPPGRCATGCARSSSGGSGRARSARRVGRRSRRAHRLRARPTGRCDRRRGHVPVARSASPIPAPGRGRDRLPGPLRRRPRHQGPQGVQAHPPPARAGTGPDADATARLRARLHPPHPTRAPRHRLPGQRPGGTTG